MAKDSVLNENGLLSDKIKKKIKPSKKVVAQTLSEADLSIISEWKSDPAIHSL